MNMHEDDNDTFCSKCGALKKDGVCQSCKTASPIQKTEPSSESIPEDGSHNERKETGKVELPVGTPAAQNYRNLDKKSNKKTAWLILIVLVVLVVAMIFAVSNLVKTAFQEAEGMININQLQEYLAEVQTEGQNQNDAEEWQPDDEEQTEIEEFSSEEAYVPSADDDYYISLSDAIDESLDYSVEWEDYEYTDEEAGIDVYIVYPRLVGDDIPNLEYLNEEIEAASMYYVNSYREQYADAEMETYQVYVAAYVTFMSDKTISIVLSEDLASDEYSTSDLYCMNIDLLTGQLVNNKDWLEFSEELAKEFREECEYQYGACDAVDSLSDEEILEYLSDDVSCIAFYTPVGLEVGFNYMIGGNSSWVTATIKDYEKYLKKI